MKLVKLIHKKLILTSDGFHKDIHENKLNLVFSDVSKNPVTDLRLSMSMPFPSTFRNEHDMSNLICQKLREHFGSPLRDLAINLRGPSQTDFDFYVEDVQVEHTDFMHTYEKSVTTSALIEVSIDDLEGEDGNNKFQFEGETFEPIDLVKRLQGYPTSDVLQLLYDANIPHKQYSLIELAQDINNGIDSFSNSYVIATLTIEVESGTK